MRPTLSTTFAVMDAHAVRLLVEAADEPAVARYFSRVWLPTEAFFSSVLAARAPDSVVSENLWYIDWNGSDPLHPRDLGTGDVPTLASVAGKPHEANGFGRAKLYARKFDVESSGSSLLLAMETALGVDYGVGRDVTGR